MKETPHAPAHGGRDAILLAAIMAVAAGLRFGFLSSRGWWFDEAFTVVGARLDLSGLIQYMRLHESSPPLYFLLAAAWTRLMGTSEAGLRSLSAVLGVVAVWLAYKTSARLVSIRAGLVAAALAAVNPMLVWFSLDARMYALLIVLSAWSFLCFMNALDEPRPRTLAAWTIASVLALWTHYFAVFLVAAEAALLFLRHPQSRSLRKNFAALALGGAALFPFLLASVRLGGWEVWMAQHSLLMRAASVPPEFLLGFQPPAPLILAPIALVTPVVALWLLMTRADAADRRAAGTAALVGGVALVCPALIALVPAFDVLATRYLSVAAAPLLIVIAAGLGARRAGRIGMATLILTCILGIAINLGTARDSKFEHEDWRGAARAAGAVNAPRALVVTPPRGRLPLGLYLPRLREFTSSQALVSELVVVALPPIFRTLGQPSLPPRPPTPAAPEAAFQMVERVETDSFTLIRYRAAVPVRVDRARLAMLRLGPQEAALLFESPEEDAAQSLPR